MAEEIPPAIQVHIDRLDQDIADLQAADRRMGVEIEAIKKELKGGFDRIEAGIDRMHNRLDDALASTLRALPPWAAVVGGILVGILGAILEGTFRGHFF